MKKKKEGDELTNNELEHVVGGLKGVGVKWDPQTGMARRWGRVLPRRPKIRPFQGELPDGGTVDVDADVEK